MAALAGKIYIRAKSAYARIAFTRIGVIFIVLTCIHCFAQGAIQVALYRGDSGASLLAANIVDAAQVPMNQVPWLQRSDDNRDLDLKTCTRIPVTQSGIESCTTVFQNFPDATPNATVDMRDLTSALARRTLDVDNITAMWNATGDVNSVKMVYNVGSYSDSVILTTQCAHVLVYSGDILEAYKYEDVALLGSQFWFLVVSFIAILFTSIPQMLAILFLRVVATMWSAYSVWHIRHYETIFSRLLVEPGTPCHFNLFPTYFSTRMGLSIADLVLNVSALLMTVCLGRSLLKTFSAFTIQRAGPPIEIVRMYRIFLALFVCLQLALFFLVSSIGLWITWLMQSQLGRLTTYRHVYDAVFIVTIATFPPWIAMGWYAVRREMKKTMILFLIICFIYVAGWSVMFYAQVFRWTFLQWPFFSSIMMVSFVVLIATGISGLLCRLNFGKGLAHYLHVEAELAKADFTPEVFSNDSNSRSTSSFNSERSLSGATMLKHDINWDLFHVDVDRVPVIVVGYGDERLHVPQ